MVSLFDSLREAKNELEEFAMQTGDQNTKKLYSDGVKQIEQVIKSISGRTQYLNKDQ
jgi:hypothetical protein